MLKKLKSFISNDQNFLLLVVISLILLSFQLGQISNKPNNWLLSGDSSHKTVDLVSSKDITNDRLTIEESETTAHSLVASKNGQNYYPLHCDAYKRINKENRVYFANEDKARAGGFIRSQLCY